MQLRECLDCNKIVPMNTRRVTRCPDCQRKVNAKASYNYRVKTGRIQQPGVGKGGARVKGPENPTWTTGIKGYRNQKKDYCEKCGTKDKKLEVHHIDKDRLHNDSSNWMTLCRPCHSKEHPKGGYKLSDSHKAALRAAWVKRKANLHAASH